MKNLTGQRYGRLTCQSFECIKNGHYYWKCICDCGREVIVRSDQLSTGRTTSCGCYSSELSSMRISAYNAKKTKKPKPDHDKRHDRWNPLIHKYPRLYSIWHSMKSRCYYEKNKCFHCYGGRGIRICQEWKESFTSFATWAINNGYADNLTIDRIDVNGNYTPNNCRWITNEEQQKNKRKRHPSESQVAVSDNECGSSSTDKMNQTSNLNPSASYHGFMPFVKRRIQDE